MRDIYDAVDRRLAIDVDVGAIENVRFGGGDAAARAAARAAATAESGELVVHYSQIWGYDSLYKLGLLDDRVLDGISFEPRKRRKDAGLDESDEVALFGEPPAPGDGVVVVANLGLLHMPNSAINGVYANTTRSALRRLSALADRRSFALTVVLVGAPSLLGLRLPGMHPDQLARFLEVMTDLKAWAANLPALDVRILDPAPLTAARRDVTFDGLHFAGTVQQVVVDALFGFFCDRPP